ncbi:laminin subunit beta-1a [Scomber scombrus]|uniref:Laminin subunit beta-1a n=1 Tax=Scomber scombrus TaxID=13677 RepID=A0AAV1Q989_SCOSC
MRGLLSVTLLLLILTLVADANKRAKNHKGGKHEKSRPASECSSAETQYGKCVPEHGDCGEGLRDATCKDRTDKIHCKIPCNWKKNISDCKYKFGPWGSCDGATKSRSGTLKRALFNADCQTTVSVSKPCSPKAKKTRGKTIRLLSEGKTTRPLSEGKTIRPLSEGKTTRPLSEGKTTRPLSEGKTTRPLSERKTIRPLSEGKTIRPLSEGKTTRPLSEGKTTRPLSEGKTTRPLSEGKTTRPLSEGKTTRPLSERKTTRPLSEGKTTRPLSELKTTRPLSEGKTTRPLSEGKTTRPLSEVASSFRLSRYWHCAGVEEARQPMGTQGPPTNVNPRPANQWEPKARQPMGTQGPPTNVNPWPANQWEPKARQPMGTQGPPTNVNPRPANQCEPMARQPMGTQEFSLQMSKMFGLLLALQVFTFAQVVGAQVVGAQEGGAQEDGSLPELSDVCTEGSCYPATGDLLIGRAHQLFSTSTCGLNRPEPFCIVSHLQEEKKCFTCDSMATYDELTNQTSNHRVENVVTTFAPNRLKTWWQSENGLENVTIQLNLEAEFHFTHLIMTFKTFRPAAMVIERSADFGNTWQVYRYFAYDCESSFSSVSHGPMQKVDDVICDSRYSDIEPSTEGEVIFRVLDPAFQIDDPYSPRIQNMLKITNLRVKFTKLHTLGDNLLDSRMEIKEKYYYAVYDMVVRGNCFCYGHASECAPIQGASKAREGMVHGHCMCNHNTKGLNCELCQDFYHDLPWRPAEGRNTNACKKCKCNQHSDSCHFDMAVFVASGNVSGGVCDECQHNTAGHNCEQCRPFYFQHPERDVRDPNICQQCNCDPVGSLNGGLCDRTTDVRTGLIAGQCRCKVNVEGERCERCKQAYYGLSGEAEGCKACTCSPLGTVPGGNPCDSETGNCFCKRLVIGRDCDQCVSEHWGLSNDVDGCRPCDCDLGGAVNNQCDQQTGQCQCRGHMFGRRCDQVESGFYFMALDHYTYEAEDATFGPGVTVVPRPHPLDRSPTWTGVGLVNVPEGAFLEFSIDNIPHSMEYDILIRYEPQLPDQWEEVLMMVMRPGPIRADSRCVNTVPDDDHQTVSLHPGSRYVVLPRPVCFESGLNYTVRLSLPLYSALSDIQSPYTLIDSIVLMPHCKNLDLFTPSEGGDSSSWDTFQRYRCLENSQGVIKSQTTDICRNFIFSISAMLHQGAKECQCDPQGSLSTVCDASGGQCQCRPNVVGRNCDRCAPSTFQFGPNGCRACECDSQGSQHAFCDQLTGQCSCVSGGYGRQCERCLPGHWGFPSCQPCTCNGHSDDCDAATGRCLACRDHSTGPHCDRCLDGYYGDPVLGSGDHCRPCMCPDGPGSLRQFAGSCYRADNSQQAICVCNTGYKGARCDECSPGYYGNPGEAGGQCRPCQCNNNINMMDPDSCDSQTGECLRCLHHSEGPSCESCKLGYYGNALLQDCRRCVCNQLGSDASSCPSSGDCHCDRSSGQCLCFPNVIGQHCDRCAADSWDLASGRGCRTCDCDAKHSDQTSCNEISGQCSCRPGFGGRTCSECRELFWGEPEVKCHACDCDPRGIVDQQCNKLTGHCVCVEGVSGPRCDSCARGFSGLFPDCRRCHQCFAEWDAVIGQLTNQTHRLVNKVNTIKASGVSGPYRKSMDSMERSAADIRVLLDQNPASQPLSEIQDLLQQASDLMGALNQALNHTEQNLVQVQEGDGRVGLKLDSVSADAQKLERTVQDLLNQVEVIKNSDIRGATDSVTKYLLQSQAAEARANASTFDPDSAVQNSARLRQVTEDKMNQSGDGFLRRHTEHAQRLDDLAGELQTLDLSELSTKTCGSLAVPDCLDSGSGCRGDDCDGLLMKAHSSWMKAQDSDQEILSAMQEVDRLSKMVSEAKVKADQAKLSAQNVLMKTNRTKQKVDQSNEELRTLIRQIRDFLTQDAADLESIENVANQVLALQMPTTAVQLQNLTAEIRQKVSELGDVEEVLLQSADDISRAENLLDQARRASEEASDVKDSAEKVKRALKEAQRAQTAASTAIRQAAADIQNTNHLLSSVELETEDTEVKLNNATQRLQRLGQDVTLLKDKAMNVTQNTKRTNQDAASIRKMAEEMKKELNSEVKGQYAAVEQLIGQKAAGVTDAKKRAESLQQEAKELLLQASNKLQLLKELERSHDENQLALEQKAEQLVELEAAVKELLQQISQQVTVYSTCLF